MTVYDTGIIGAGAWGTAVASHLARKGQSVLVWVYEKDLYDTLKTVRENTSYLPGFTLPRNMDFTDSLERLAGSTQDIIIATPSFATRTTIARASGQLGDKNILL